MLFELKIDEVKISGDKSVIVGHRITNPRQQGSFQIAGDFPSAG
jgi:hypothetical protein